MASSRACLEGDPGDESARLALVRAAVEAGDLDAAMDAVREGESLSWGDSDWALWEVRLLAWQGHAVRAEMAFQKLPPLISTLDEAVRLHADLAFFASDFAAAAERYDAVLVAHPDDSEARWRRAVAARALGDETRAVAEFGALCRQAPSDARACKAIEPRKPYRLTLSPAFAVSKRATETGLFAELDALGPGERQAGVGVEFRRRAPATGAVNDTLMHGSFGTALTEDVLFSAGASLGPGAQIAPRAQLWVEPSVQLDERFSFSLRLWYLRFHPENDLVLVPAIVFTPSRWIVDLRDFLAFRAGGTFTQSALLRARRMLGTRFSVMGGAGLGQGADFLGAPRAGAGDHLLLLAGLGLDVDAHSQLRADYVFRREVVPAQTLIRNEVVLTWMQLF